MGRCGPTEFLPSAAPLDSFPSPSLVAPWSSSRSNYSTVRQAHNLAHLRGPTRNLFQSRGGFSGLESNRTQ